MRNLLDSTFINLIDPIVISWAINSCDFERLNLYLDQGLMLGCYSQEGLPNMLNHLSYCRKTDIVKRDQILDKLLQAGLKPNEGIKGLEPGAAGIYPLSKAVESCDENMINILLKYGANPNLKTLGEDYFPAFNICEPERNLSALPSSPHEHSRYKPTEALPLGKMMVSLLKHGADPNTLYISNDRRNFATENREQVLKTACSGEDIQAESLYDFYLHRLENAQHEGDRVKIDNFRRAFDALVDYGAQPLEKLCKQQAVQNPTRPAKPRDEPGHAQSTQTGL
ncbi:MAG: hypothetical protein R3F02_04325 [Thiolinea sp.]